MEAMKWDKPNEISAEAMCAYTQLFGYIRNIIRVIAERAHEASTWTLIAAILCTIDQGKIEFHDALATNKFDTAKLLGDRIELPLKTKYVFIECMLRYEFPDPKLGANHPAGWGSNTVLTEAPYYLSLPNNLKFLQVSEAFRTSYNRKLSQSEKDTLRQCEPMSTNYIALVQCHHCNMPTKLNISKVEVALVWNTYATEYPKACLMMNLADTSTMPQACRPQCLRCRAQDGRQAPVPVMSMADVRSILQSELC